MKRVGEMYLESDRREKEIKRGREKNRERERVLCL